MAFPTLSLPARLTMAGFVLLALMAISVPSRAETPKEAVDRVWNAYLADMGKNNAAIFEKNYLLLSRDVAREQRVAVLEPIMLRAKDWKSEECLIFVPLVCFLPRDQSTALLNRYKKEGKPWEQQAATDFLIEFDMDDTKAMIASVPKK